MRIVFSYAKKKIALPTQKTSNTLATRTISYTAGVVMVYTWRVSA